MGIGGSELKRYRLISLAVIGVAIMLTGFISSPLFAQTPGDEAKETDGIAWEEMHQACANGDQAAMEEAAAETHGGDISDMPCGDNSGLEMGGHMGGDMMSGGTY